MATSICPYSPIHIGKSIRTIWRSRHYKIDPITSKKEVMTSTDDVPCPILEKGADNIPHICIWDTCRLNYALALYNEGIDKFSKPAINTTLRGFLKTSEMAEKADGYRDLIPEDATFCKCSACCCAAIRFDARIPAVLHFISSLKEVLSRH